MRSGFNQPIGDWNVSNVTNMSEMFSTTAFNQPIANWNVGNVTNMSQMFYYADFNQPIDNWDVSSVENFSIMFYYSDFNQPLGNWDVSAAVNMSKMFYQSLFNHPIENWDVSSVENMCEMFSSSAFNQPIGGWDVGNVTDMRGMFSYSPFNQPIDAWNVGNVESMMEMFMSSPFNQPTGSWDVGNVVYMAQMFTNTPFDQPIGNWDVSNVINMERMFNQTHFNQPIGNWNVSNATLLGGMFWENESFNQDLSSWTFHPYVNFNIDFYQIGFLSGSSYSSENYDLLLQSFSNQNLINKTFPAPGLVYCNTSARNDLINNKNWTITGDIEQITSITAPNEITLVAGPDSCFVSNVDLGSAAVQCCFNYTISNNAPELFQSGTTEVIWTITDENGTTVSDVQLVTVVINADEASVCYVSRDDIETTKNRIFIQNIDWSNVDHYEVLREAGANYFQPIGDIQQGEYSLLDLTSNNETQAYRYRVRTIDICENVMAGSPIHKTIYLQSATTAYNTVYLFWNNYQGISFDHIKLYRKVNVGDFELIATLPSSNSNYNDYEVNIFDNNYEYYLAIEIDPCASNGGLNTVEIKSNKARVYAVDIRKSILMNQITLYPNPVDDRLNIALPENIAFKSCRIYNASGEKLMTKTTKSFSVSQLPPATYYVIMETCSGDIAKTFIKIDPE